VVVPGTFNVFVDANTLPRFTVGEVRAIPDVQWAERGTSYTILSLDWAKAAGGSSALTARLSLCFDATDPRNDSTYGGAASVNRL